MKLLTEIVALALLVISIQAESDYNLIQTICYYFDDVGEVENFKVCLKHVDSVLPSKTSVTNEESKKCTEKLPPRFSACGSQPDTKSCLVREILAYRLETQAIFKKLHKEVLSRKEISRWFQVWGAFIMFFSMAKELPQKATNKLIDTAKICYDPLVTDLVQFDEPETEGLEESRNVRETEDNERKIVKNVFKRGYRWFLCSVKKIDADKEARSVVMDFLPSYHGIIPAKVARLSCTK